MDKSHVLIKIAKKKPFNQKQHPCNAFYDSQKGYWVTPGGCLVTYCSEFGAVGTKKEDIETGEDIKSQ